METTTDTNSEDRIGQADPQQPTDHGAANDQFTPPPPISQPRRLQRSSDGPLGGVAGGIANYFDIDPTLVRLGLVAGTLMYGGGLLVYVAAWLIIPPAPSRALPPPPPMVYS